MNYLPSLFRAARMTALVTLLSGVTLPAAEIYVAPSGSDANPGTVDQPIASLRHAQELARSSKHSAPVTVRLRAGVYYLTAPIVFTAADSGTAQAPVSYQAFNDEKPVLSGGVRLTHLAWTPYRNGILQTPVPADLRTDQLFVNGERQILARYPNSLRSS